MVNSTIEINTQRSHGLINQMQYILMMESCYIVCLVLASVGVLSNVINIRVFAAMGIQDGVTVSFLALSIFDLAYLMSSLSLALSTAFYICELKFKIKFQIDPFAVFAYSANIMIIISVTNVLTTTFLAVVRCLCVAKPLQFKNTITKKRAILFMSGIAIFSFTIYVPVLANMGIVMKFDMSSNTSRPSLWMSPNRDIVKNNTWMVTEMFLPIVTQLVILVCIVIMVRCLRAASKFRQSSGAASAMADDDNIRQNKNQTMKNIISDSNITTDRLTGKDLRVVQQVVLISTVYIVCNVPKILISFCTIIEPDFTYGKRYTNIYASVNCLRKHFEIINAAVNLIIYYKYNTKFRSFLCVKDT